MLEGRYNDLPYHGPKDIRLGTFASFVSTLINQNPYLFGGLLPHKPDTAQIYLRGDLALNPQAVSRLNRRMCQHYGIEPDLWLKTKLTIDDLTLEMYYQLLWAKANQQSTRKRPYVAPHEE